MTKRQQDLFQTDLPPWALDEAEDQVVATVVFAEPPYGPFDYRVPEELRTQVTPGCRVRVPLGRGNRGVVGYCVAVEHRSHLRRALKDILAAVEAFATSIELAGTRHAGRNTLGGKHIDKEERSL